MATATKTGLGQTIKRVKRAWAEMDYAQRRLFEIRTGIPASGRDEAARPATTVDELETLYELDETNRAA